MKETIFKRTVQFNDKNNKKFTIDIEISGGRFSMSGDYGGGAGQVQDNISPANKPQEMLLELWHKYHLNDMKAGTPEQMALIESKEFENFKKKYFDIRKQKQAALDQAEKKLEDYYSECRKSKSISRHKEKELQKAVKIAQKDFDFVKDSDHYTIACNFLMTKEMYVVPHPETGEPYKYGSAWLSTSIPADIEYQVDSVIQEIEEAEEERAGKPLTDLSDADLLELIESKNLFSDEREINLCAALVRMFDLSENDLEDISIDGTDVCVNGINYHAGTDEEMDEVATVYIKDSLWAFNSNFLAQQTDMPEEVFKALQPQCESANEAVEAIVEKTCGIEEFVEAAISADGRAHFLNNWDGSEETATVEGEDYYAYRN